MGIGKDWDQLTHSSSRRPRCVTQKFWKRRVHRRESFNFANFRSEIHGLPNSRNERKMKSSGMSGATAKQTGTWQRMSTNSKMESQNAFYYPAEAWVMPAPSSTKPEERQFVIDSGASLHMLRKKDLSSGELETLKNSRTSMTVETANGEAQTNEEAQVYVHDLHILVTVPLLEDTLAVLSLGKLCKEHSCTYECSQWSRATSDQTREANLLQNWELRPISSSRTFIEFHHNFILNIASAGSVYFFGLQQTREVTRELREIVAKKLRETAAQVFLNGRRTAQRISKS